MSNLFRSIYLDHNATTPVDTDVVAAMLPYFTHAFANASSSHIAGLTVAEAVEDAIIEIADLIGAKPKEITITSGATEAVNLAIKGLFNATRKHIVTVETEHKAVLDTCRWMQSQGFEVTYVPVDRNGLIDIENLRLAVTSDTLLVCVMWANNETGVIQPIKEIAAIAHQSGALFMTDATQAVGKIPIDVREMDIDLLQCSPHKFYGPKGIGALYISETAKVKLIPQIHGGGHQRNLRSGTLNVPSIIGFGKACALARDQMDGDSIRIGALRDKLENGLLQIQDSFVNGASSSRLYNTTNMCFPGINSEKAIIALQNIAVSSGSACSAATTKPSHVLMAMGLSDEEALASIRFSLGRTTSEDDIDHTIKTVAEIVLRLRGEL